ncbi:MAG: acetyl-CoA carboxylase biotin carboxyl carrier protein subunit, partial [Muribaculaceae bacterium]|nr:acetyl-CoA carboxylase biotin carboxyl carrier protein subunit [Muribaculaceae bacterium]
PMGGTILSVKVKPGDAVKVGDTVLIYEAMKMENNLGADRDGVIAKVLVADGDVMATDQPLIQYAAGGAAPVKEAPKPVAKPAPAAKAPAAGEYKVAPVEGFDINKALHPLEGGSGKAPKFLKNNDGSITLAPGTTLDINVAPDGNINIRITKN